MKCNTTLKLSLIFFALVGIKTSAQAEVFDYNKVVGHHKVKSCTFKNRKNKLPNDYYCNARAITIEKVSDGVFTLSYVDELGQTFVIPTLEQFQRKSYAITDEAQFINEENSTSWKRDYVDSVQDTEIHETYAFSVDKSGTLKLIHTFIYSTYSGLKTKFYTWEYDLD